MLNFLPQNNRKTIITEYLSRVLVVFLNLLLLAVVVLIFLFVPSSIFSKYKSATVKNQLESIKVAGINQDQDPIELIKKINNMVAILSEGKTVPISMSEMVQKIVTIKNKDIKISAISITKDTANSERIVVNGTGKTRDSLTLFAKDLRDDGTFNSVDLPISNLIKNTDAPFTITLVYNKK